MKLHYIMVVQQGNKSDDLWSTLVVSKECYDNVVDTLNNQDFGILDEMVESYNAEDIIADCVDKEESILIAQDYADNHAITLMVIVPII